MELVESGFVLGALGILVRFTPGNGKELSERGALELDSLRFLEKEEDDGGRGDSTQESDDDSKADLLRWMDQAGDKPRENSKS